VHNIEKVDEIGSEREVLSLKILTEKIDR